MADLIKYQGGCHCGAILFEVYAPKTPAIIHSYKELGWRDFYKNPAMHCRCEGSE